MKRLLKAIMILFLVSCNTTKQDKNEILKMDEKMLKENYHIGLVERLKDETCGYYTILDIRNNTKYDPVNFDDEPYLQMKTKHQSIYFKYDLLRAKPRCNNINRIRLIDIIERN